MSSNLYDLPKKLVFDGAHNFRDMGGYPLSAGRKLKSGRLYRSDHLGNLSVEDGLRLADLGVKTVIDLRNISERDSKPNRLQVLDIRQIHLPINEKGADVNELLRLLAEGELNADDAHQYLMAANESFVLHFKEQFQLFFQYLLAEENYPLVFHCAAGKDRTGFLAALVLFCLGADSETVFHDYLASNTCTDNSNEKLIQDMIEGGMKSSDQTLRTLLQVKAEYLQFAIDTTVNHHGSLDGYLENNLSINKEKRTRLKDLLSC